MLLINCLMICSVFKIIIKSVDKRATYKQFINKK